MIDASLAPLVLFVYNRPELTQQTLRALGKNDLAKKSELFIFADGAKPNSSAASRAAVEEVRSVIAAEKWCGKVTIRERSENLGLASSIISGVTEVVAKYGKVIVLEDDLITAPGFLSFMNDALNQYEAEAKVFGITGFKAPSRRPEKFQTFFLPVMSSWSWATWIDRWETVSFDGPDLLRRIESSGKGQALDLNGYPFYQMLQNQVAGKVDSWAIRFYASMFLQERWFLYPAYSLVQNIGFGNAATHTATNSHIPHFLERVKIEKTYLALDRPPLVIDPKVKKSFRLGYGYLWGKVNGLRRRWGRFWKT